MSASKQGDYECRIETLENTISAMMTARDDRVVALVAENVRACQRAEAAAKEIAAQKKIASDALTQTGEFSKQLYETENSLERYRGFVAEHERINMPLVESLRKITADFAAAQAENAELLHTIEWLRREYATLVEILQ